MTNQEKFMAYANKRLMQKAKKENEADKYLKSRGADSNRRYAMHRKRSGR